MIKRNNTNPLRALHKLVSEIISIPMGPLAALLIFSLAGSSLMVALAEKGKTTFSVVLPYLALSSFVAWCVVALIHNIHGRIFLPWRPEPLDGTRWRTPAGTVGLFKQKNFDGSLVLAFPSGVVAEYKRRALVQED
ncbi:hypothetical protein O9X98_05780 [Agrobacterium salinitolerans]|nr:hypothetical protein [Agrobacterium salinitolerans]